MSHDERPSVRAAVFRAPATAMGITDVPVPELRAGEALVKVSACTLCGSDLHTYRGDRDTPVPTVLGHEILGRIASLGPGSSLTDLRGQVLVEGDRITWSVAVSCGDCFYCRCDLPQKCEKLFKYGHEQMRSEHALSGGLAEFVHLAAGSAVVRIADDVPDAVACPANCATATVCAALERGFDEGAPSTVLVLGAGMLGLTACAMLRTRGVEHVIACDVDAERLEWARRFGATETVSAEGLARGVANLTEGRGVGLALEFSGSPQATAGALECLRMGGRLVLVGAVFPTAAVPVHPETIVRRLTTICGVHNYRPRDLLAAVDFLERHHREFPFASLVTDTFSLAEVTRAFESAVRSRAPRVMVRPGD